MSSFENSREYKFKEFLRYTRTRPYACQPLMKNFWQCFDYFHYQKNQDEIESKRNCLEKFNFLECVNENKEKCLENWMFNVEVNLPEGAAAGEEEEE
jgi:hypothetical protein